MFTLCSECFKEGFRKDCSVCSGSGVTTWRRPPIRKLFTPDPGMILCDADLSGADAQVVAWDSGQEELKDAFRQGLDIHNFNGKRIWGDAYNPKTVRRKLAWRDECKRGVHGTNYLVSERELAKILGWKITEVRQFQDGYFRANPKILEWQQRVNHDIQTTRSVSNLFGFSIHYHDRPANILPKALAWIPQSTVGICCSKAAIQLSRQVPWCEILLQVHDSIVFQFPIAKHSPSGYAAIYQALKVVVPYPDPLIIPWGLKMSESSWGTAEKITWQELQVA